MVKQYQKKIEEMVVAQEASKTVENQSRKLEDENTRLKQALLKLESECNILRDNNEELLSKFNKTICTEESTQTDPLPTPPPPLINQSKMDIIKIAHSDKTTQDLLPIKFLNNTKEHEELLIDENSRERQQESLIDDEIDESILLDDEDLFLEKEHIGVTTSPKIISPLVNMSSPIITQQSRYRISEKESVLDVLNMLEEQQLLSSREHMDWSIEKPTPTRYINNIDAAIELQKSYMENNILDLIE